MPKTKTKRTKGGGVWEMITGKNKNDAAQPPVKSESWFSGLLKPKGIVVEPDVVDKVPAPPPTVVDAAAADASSPTAVDKVAPNASPVDSTATSAVKKGWWPFRGGKSKKKSNRRRSKSKSKKRR